MGSVATVNLADPDRWRRPRSVLPVPLNRLLDDPAPVEVRGVTADSRAVRAGDLYVGLPGRRHHGASFAVAAGHAGAVAVLTDGPGARLAQGSGLPVVVVSDPRRTMADAAAQVYGRPAERLAVYGVTGTNGKTTVTSLLAAALRAGGRHTGVIGTLGFSLDGQSLPTVRSTVTTPESPDLQALLAGMAESGADSIALEVSSHALALRRVDAIGFAAVAFTTFGRDHLDFHGTVEAYWAAKASLFTLARATRAVVNIDDPRGPELVGRARADGLEVLTVSLDHATADYHAEAVRTRPDGHTAFTGHWPGGRTGVQLALPGAYNVRNALTALALADLGGVSPILGAVGLGGATVAGRMQRVALPQPAPAVYVDFAHTPQAVASALQVINSRRTLVVLGCGGDRDPDKRAAMGAAAATAADLVVVTDDNPRTEDPARIRAAVRSGAEAVVGRRAAEICEMGDRRSAIARALAEAGPEDVVAVLGKGHERGQEVGTVVKPFDDAAVVVQEWHALGRNPERSEQ